MPELCIDNRKKNNELTNENIDILINKQRFWISSRSLSLSVCVTHRLNAIHASSAEMFHDQFI